jgi:hypothetical protein
MEYYEEQKAINKAYDDAEAMGSNEGCEAARVMMRGWKANILAESRAFQRVYRMYESSMNRGNAAIDINEVIWDKDLDDLMDAMKENGITRFTYSSEWSSAVLTAWKFIEAGWKLVGMEMINGCNTDYSEKSYVKVPAYVFSI